MYSLLEEVKTMSQQKHAPPPVAASPSFLSSTKPSSTAPPRSLSQTFATSMPEPKLKLIAQHYDFTASPSRSPDGSAAPAFAFTSSTLNSPVREAFVSSPTGPGVLDESAYAELKSTNVAGRADPAALTLTSLEGSTTAAARRASPRARSPDRTIRHAKTSISPPRGGRRTSDGVKVQEYDEDDDDSIEVRSTATGYGAGGRVPRPKLALPASVHEKLVTYGSPLAKARPTSAPLPALDVPDAANAADASPNALLRRYFEHIGVKIPYQYFYKRNSMEVIPVYDLRPWRTFIDDALLIILGGCTGHTRVATKFLLDYCPAVSDLGLSVVLPRLPKLRELDLHDCTGVGDTTLLSVTMKVPDSGAAHGTLLQIQNAASAVLGAGANGDGDKITAPAVIHVTVAGITHKLPRGLMETTARVYPETISASAAALKAAATSKGAMVMPCPKLTAINVNGCPKVSDQSLMGFCARLTTVTSLDLCGTSITDNGVRELLIKCRWLKRLRIARTAVTDAAFDQLLLMGRLIPVNPLVQRKDVLASRAPKTTVTIGGVSQPVDEYYLILEDIDLSGCAGISAEGLKPLLMVRGGETDG